MSKYQVDCGTWWGRLRVKWFGTFCECEPVPVPDPVPLPVPFPPTPPTPIPPAVVYVNGDERDKTTDSASWLHGLGGFADVRLSCNDVQNLAPRGVPCHGPWYDLNPRAVNYRAECMVEPDGSVRARLLQDQVSPITGQKYHMVGVMVATTQPSTPLRQGNDIMIPRAECRQTLRIMFVTIK